MNASLSDITYHHAEEVGLWKWLLSLKGAESDQPVCHFSSGWAAETMQESFASSWQAQERLAYRCRDQRKHVFHNMGPLKNLDQYEGKKPDRDIPNYSCTNTEHTHLRSCSRKVVWIAIYSQLEEVWTRVNTSKIHTWTHTFICLRNHIAHTIQSFACMINVKFANIFS